MSPSARETTPEIGGSGKGRARSTVFPQLTHLTVLDLSYRTILLLTPSRTPSLRTQLYCRNRKQDTQEPVQYIGVYLIFTLDRVSDTVPNSLYYPSFSYRVTDHVPLTNYWVSLSRKKLILMTDHKNRSRGQRETSTKGLGPYLPLNSTYVEPPTLRPLSDPNSLRLLVSRNDQFPHIVKDTT